MSVGCHPPGQVNDFVLADIGILVLSEAVGQLDFPHQGPSGLCSPAVLAGGRVELHVLEIHTVGIADGEGIMVCLRHFVAGQHQFRVVLPVAHRSIQVDQNLLLLLLACGQAQMHIGLEHPFVPPRIDAGQLQGADCLSCRKAETDGVDTARWQLDGMAELVPEAGVPIEGRTALHHLGQQYA